MNRLESLGATRVHELDQGPAGRWRTMRDPEGNEFDASQAVSHRRLIPHSTA